MTFGQLQAELRRLERRFSQATPVEMEPDEMRHGRRIAERETGRDHAGAGADSRQVPLPVARITWRPAAWKR